MIKIFLAFWKKLFSDKDAKFDKEVNITASDIEPLVTWGTSPQDVASVTSNVPDPEKEENNERKVRAENFRRVWGGAKILYNIN